jgi:hypothetical protein
MRGTLIYDKFPYSLPTLVAVNEWYYGMLKPNDFLLVVILVKRDSMSELFVGLKRERAVHGLPQATGVGPK